MVWWKPRVQTPCRTSWKLHPHLSGNLCITNGWEYLFLLMLNVCLVTKAEGREASDSTGYHYSLLLPSSVVISMKSYHWSLSTRHQTRYILGVEWQALGDTENSFFFFKENSQHCWKTTAIWFGLETRAQNNVTNLALSLIQYPTVLLAHVSPVTQIKWSTKALVTKATYSESNLTKKEIYGQRKYMNGQVKYMNGPMNWLIHINWMCQKSTMENTVGMRASSLDYIMLRCLRGD